jgi:radical SAM superfamily enzyme YgiQ (UPF0313 family)
MKIALIQCPCWGIYTPPLGIASLSAYLRNRGYKVMVLDFNIDMYLRCQKQHEICWDESMNEFWRSEPLVEKFISDYEGLIRYYLGEICNCGAGIIGFSIYDTSMFFSLILAKKIKERCPDKLIVFGGPHCSKYMTRNFIMLQGVVDVIVEGEGEETLSEIVELAGKEHKIDFCQGTVIRKENKIVDCGNRPLIENLDTLPFPDFSDFPVESYLRKNVFPVSSSRGCVNRCVFCNEWPYWKKYRFKTGYHIFQEIKYILSQYPKTTNIEFHDSVLNGNLEQINILCDLILEENLRIRWNGQAIINPRMDYNLLVKMKKSGCGCLDYGLESGSQAIITRMRKRFNISDADRIIKETYETGIDVVLNFMFGFPGETEEDFKETLDFVSRNKNYITAVNPAPSFCGIAPGTYLYEHLEEFGVATPMDNGHFWRSSDKKNDYLIRLNRFERFCEFVHSLGIKSTYPKTALVNRYRVMGDYYFYIQDYSKALEYYRISLEEEMEDKKILKQIDECARLLR